MFGFFYRDKSGIETPLEIENAMTEPATSKAETPPAERGEPAVAELRHQLGFAETPEGIAMSAKLAAQDAQIARLQAEADANRRAEVEARAKAFAASLAAPGARKIAASGQSAVAGLYATLAEDDRANPRDDGTTRLAALEAAFATVPGASEQFAASLNGKPAFAVENVERGADPYDPLAAAVEQNRMAFGPPRTK